MEERKFVGVLVGLEGGFVHQSANGEVRHYEAIEFLANQVGVLLRKTILAPRKCRPPDLRRV
jgi:hypothetical protein